MTRETYRLTEPVASFEEGTVLEVTARYGPQYVDTLELEPTTKTRSEGKLRVADDEVGFGEAAILDETARIGDWHEYECTFETTTSESRLRMSEFQAVTEPVEAPA